MRRLATVVVLGCALHVGASQDALADTGDWWCPKSWSWSTSSIPVYIHPDLANSMLHHDETLWTDTEVRRELQAALEQITDQAPTGIPPLHFVAFDSSPGSNTILVKPDSDGTCLEDCRICTTDVKPSKGIEIAFAISQECPQRYGHWDYSVEALFRGVLTHELMHALGFRHSSKCNSDSTTPDCTGTPGAGGFCGLMQAHGTDSEYMELEKSDYNALVSKYGTWENDGGHRVAKRRFNWWESFGTLPVQSAPYMTANWGKGSTLMPLATREPTTLHPHLWRWKRSGGLADWGVPSLADQMGPIATSASYGKRYLFLLEDQTETYTRKRLLHSTHTSSTDYVVHGPSLDAARQGYTGVHDGRSGKLIHVYRNELNEIVLALSSPDGTPAASTTPRLLQGSDYRAAWTPSISCGPATVSYNCILVWGNAAQDGTGRHNHTLMWTQFRVVNDAFEFPNPVYELGYIQFAPPTVSWAGPAGAQGAGSKYGFVVAWKNPGKCFFTLRKGEAVSDTFSVQKSFCAPSGSFIGPPFSGGVEPDNYYEAWTVYNSQ